MPAVLAREVIRSYLDQRWDELGSLLHPECELETGFSVPGARFWKKAAIDAGWAALSTGAFQPEYQALESLDEETALVAVHLRYEIGSGLYSERDAVYLMRFEDELLRQTRVYDSIEAALGAHREQSETR